MKKYLLLSLLSVSFYGLAMEEARHQAEVDRARLDLFVCIRINRRIATIPFNEKICETSKTKLAEALETQKRYQKSQTLLGKFKNFFNAQEK